MLWSIRYRLLCWLLRTLVRCGLDELDLETVVLHQQLKVLRRGGRRVLFTTTDRAFLAAAARVLSRHRWKSFLVGPDTLARWHRDLLDRRSGRGSRPPGRPRLDPSIKHLILRLGREKPPVGLPQDPRGAPEARHRRLGHDDRHGASRRRTRPGATPDLLADPAHRALGEPRRSGAPPASPNRGFTVLIDTRERNPYRFAGRDVHTERVALPAGDYAVRSEDGAILAAAERKGMENLATCLSDGTLAFQMQRLAEVPIAAVVVEGRYSRLHSLEHVSGGWLADVPTRLQVRYAEVQIFADTR